MRYVTLICEHNIKNEVKAVSNNNKKITTLWTLYALNIIPITIAIASAFDVFTNWMTDKRPTSLHIFYDKTNFFMGDSWFFGRMQIMALIALLFTVIIIVIDKKEIFSKKSALFLIAPYIISPTAILIDLIFKVSNYPTVYDTISFFNIFLLIATQIYLIVKLAKATKQLKA